MIRPTFENILVIDEPLPGPPDATRILEFSTIAGSDDAVGRYNLTGVMPPTTGIALDALQRIYVASRDSYLLVYFERAQ